MPPVSSSRRQRSRSLVPYARPAVVAAPPPLPPPTFDPHYFSSIPPGCRFMPTDEELVAHYLIPYLASQPLPPNRILGVDIYCYHPKHLAEVYKDCGENVLYFFTQRTKKYPKGSRPSRSTGTGYWKATGKDEDVMCSRRQTKIASRKCLVFYEGESNKGTKTNWLMHEYRLNTDPTDKTFEECALCKIYLKPSACKIKAGEDGGDSDTLVDQNNEDATHQPHSVTVIGGLETQQTGGVANAGLEQLRQHQETSSDHLPSDGQPTGNLLLRPNDQLMSAYPTPHPVSGTAGVETEQTGGVANTGLEQCGQYQQTSSDHLPQDGQLMGDFLPPQNVQLMSAYPTPHPVNSVRSLNIDQTGTVAYTGHVYAHVEEQHLQYPQTSCDQLFPGDQLLGDWGDCSYPPLVGDWGDCSYPQMLGDCSYSQNDQLMGDYSYPLNDQLMGDYSYPLNDQTAYPNQHPVSGIRTLNTEQNGMITDTRYGTAHIEELGQHPQPSSDHSYLNDNQPLSVDATQKLTPSIKSMKLEDNGQPQQAGSEHPIWNYLRNIADLAQPNYHFDSSDWLYANPLVDEDQSNNQCNNENPPNNPSTKNVP